MLLILVSNAIKFTPDGGQVEISCKLIKNIVDLTVADKEFIRILRKANGK